MSFFADCCHACEDVRVLVVEKTDGAFAALTSRKFVVCRTCGNKRCPKAQHHDRVCTGSNEPGQEGGG